MHNRPCKEVIDMVRATLTRVCGSVMALIPGPPLARAQMSPAAPATPPAGGVAASGSSGAIFAVLALVVVFVILAVSVKLSDQGRRRREEGVALEARLSDALMLDASLSNSPIVASVHMPLFRKYPPVVEVNGKAPTQEVKAIALLGTERELAGREAGIEDHVVVDPRLFRHVA